MSRCSAPIEGHQGDTKAARACPVHGGAKSALPRAEVPPPSASMPVVPAEPSVEREYRDDGTLLWEQHYVGDVLHNEEGPSWVWYREDGETVGAEIWFADGVKHREGAPAATTFYEDGSPRGEEWCLRGDPARPDGGPTRTMYRPDGSVASEVFVGEVLGHEREVSYFDNGDTASVTERRGEAQRGTLSHSDDGPARVTFHPDGSVASEEWLDNGAATHRENLPYRVEYRPDGSVASEEWPDKEGSPASDLTPVKVLYSPDGRAKELWPRHPEMDLPLSVWRDADGAITGSRWRDEDDSDGAAKERRKVREAAFQRLLDSAEADGKEFGTGRPCSPDRTVGARRRMQSAPPK